MKKFYTIALAMLAAGAASAQITLDQNSYASKVIAPDTFAGLKSPYPQLKPDANSQLWDFTGSFYESTRYYENQYTGTNTALPGAEWYSQRRIKLGTHDSLRLITNRWSGITATGFMRIGETTERYAIGLGQFGLPFASTDSLVILKQDAPYSAPYPLIKFPATHNSSWSASFELVIDMELTFAAQSYNKAPFRYKTRTNYDFTVPGFGKAQINLFDGSISEEMDVLLERIGGTTTDSFFVNGAPAPSTLLGPLGLTQNKVATNYFAELFRPNEVNALVLYLYGADNTFSTVESAQIHQLRVPFRASVESISADGKMALYPNPVSSGRQLTIRLSSAANGNYTYRLSQVTGAVAEQGAITARGSNELNITLPATLANGVYWLTLSNDKGETATAPFRLAD